MEKSGNYWKEQYFKVYAENRQLRLELETIKKDYEELKEKYKGSRSPGLLKVPSRKKSMKIMSSNDLDHLKTIAGTIVAPAYDILKIEDSGLSGSFKFSATNANMTNLKAISGTISSTPHEIVKLGNSNLHNSFKLSATYRTQKLTQQEDNQEKHERIPSDPDFNPDLYMFEELFIISVNADFKSPTIIGRYPNNFDIPAFSVLHDFCFPAGIHVRQLLLSDSASELNRLLYGQNILMRNENMFVFTLKPQDIHSSMQYSCLDILYCCCIVVEDISKYEKADWIVPKCFCLVSYFPLFDLHFQLLSKLLYMIRIRRMEELGGLTASIGSLLSPDLTETEQSLLEVYRNKSEPLPNSSFFMEVQMQDPISLNFPKDFHSVESIWLCSPLFSLLRFEDFFWLWNAILLEKSIVVVSCNLAIMTSVVLGLKNLIRPFIWPHVLLPIVPDSLRELLEAPVPLLIGIPSPAPPLRKSYKNIVWVMLDEPQEKRRLQPSSQVLEEVREMYADGIKQKMQFHYNDFGQGGIVYQPTERQVQSIKSVLRLMFEQLSLFLKTFPKLKIVDLVNIQSSPNLILQNFQKADHLFLKSFFGTQLLVTYLESVSGVSDN